MTVIYKILRDEEYRALQELGETNGAPIDVADGYIHFSTAETVAETAAKYFDGIQDLKLLAYDDSTLGDALKYEPSRGGQLFPHLYAALRMSDALWVKDLPFENGMHQFPAGLS